MAALAQGLHSWSTHARARRAQPRTRAITLTDRALAGDDVRVIKGVDQGALLL